MALVTLLQVPFDDINQDGLPYACKSFGFPRGDKYAEASIDGSGCVGLPDGEEFGYAEFKDKLPNPSSSDSGIDNVLLNLFVKAFDVKTRYQDGYSIGFRSDSSLAKDKSDVRNIATLLPPQIYSLNPATCPPDLSVSSAGPCTAGDKNNISINRRNGLIKDYAGDAGEGGDGPDDANKDNVVDAIVSRGGYSARLSFFAFADHDRMPIRRVMVDWGDEKGTPPQNYNTYGLYYNRKPYCGEDNGTGVSECKSAENSYAGITCDLGSSADQCKIIDPSWTCSSLPARFGNATRACKEEQFNFKHNYGCNDQELSEFGIEVGDLNNTGEYGDAYIKLTSQGLKPTDQVCVFKPKAQVIDNWGWCNGVCGTDLSPGGTGCYDEAHLSSALVPHNECSSPLPTDTPWTEYQGEIIVIPSN